MSTTSIMVEPGDSHQDDSQYAIHGDHNIREKVKPVPPDYWEVLGKDISARNHGHYPSYFAAFYPDKKTVSAPDRIPAPPQGTMMASG